MLAVAIVLYAITFIEERNLKKYFMYILLATSIHTTAITMLPLYFFFNLRISKFLGVVLIILSFVISSKIIPFILLFFANLEGYTKYMLSELKDETYISTNLIFHSVIALLYLFFNKKNTYLYTIAFMGLLVVNSLSLIDVVGRIGIYMKITFILILPQINTIFKQQIIDYFFKYGLALLLFLVCIVMLLANTEGVYPYSFL